MAEKLTFRILTPSRQVLDRQVDAAHVMAAEGEVGILPGHAPLLASMRPGVAYYQDGEETHFFALSDGFLEVSDDVVTALVTVAEPADEIDLERAEERRRQREAELREQDLKDFQMRSAEVSLEKQVARTTAIRLHRGG
jgi:F-type H+-transporting ATPase subunit epsilon